MGDPARPRAEGRVLGTVRRILAVHARPHELGLSVALGVVVGFTPLYGVQTVLAFAAAWLFRLNGLVAALAAQISFAPVAPLLVFASVQTGELILHGHTLALDFAEYRAHGFAGGTGHVLAAWFVGGATLGVLVGAALGATTWLLARRRQATRPPSPVHLAVPRVAARFAAMPGRVRQYVRIKLVVDPGWTLAAELLLPECATADARLVDIGCGYGVVPLLLAEAHCPAHLVGIDWDAGKLAFARRAAASLPRVDFTAGDLREIEVPACTAALVLDVLHYHPVEVQDEMLARISAALAPGGVLLVREADRGEHPPGARWAERLGAALGFHRTAGRFHYRSVESLCARVRTLGFAVEVRPAGDLMHRANVLISGRKLPSP